MRFVADENFPRPATEALRKKGWDVFSVAEELPGIADEEVAVLCADQERILLTFDKDFGELVFRRGLSAGSGVVLFRMTPEFPEEAAEIALALRPGSCPADEFRLGTLKLAMPAFGQRGRTRPPATPSLQPFLHAKFTVL